MLNGLNLDHRQIGGALGLVDIRLGPHHALKDSPPPYTQLFRSMSPGGPPTLPDCFYNKRQRNGMLRSYAIEDLPSRVLRMTRPERADANASAGSLIKMPADLLMHDAPLGC
jgi:hypothetical protein